MPGKFVALSVMICTIWASLGIVIKIGLDDAPPLGLGSARLLVAAIALWIWAGGRGSVVPALAQARAIMISIAGFSLLMVFTHLGFDLTSASRGVVFLNTTPLFVALLASFVSPREPLNAAKIAGLALAFAGVFAIFGDALRDGASLLGDALMLLGAISWAFHTVWTKKAAKAVDPALLTFSQLAGAAAVLGALSLATEPVALWRPSAKLAACVLYLALIGTAAAWLLWAHVLKDVDASAASVYIFLVPLIGALMSHLVLHEAITQRFALGACLISAGIFSVSRWGGTIARPKTSALGESTGATPAK